MKMVIDKEKFGKVNGKDVFLFILKNSAGMEVKVTNYGATITSIILDDKNNKKKDVVLGFNSLDGYISENYINSGPYLGATIGRYANRIAHGKFKIDNQEFILAQNNGGNALHGGKVGFDKVVWDCSSEVVHNVATVEFSYISKDMEEGFPGNLKTFVKFSLNNANELSINYSATTDKTTPICLTNHSYFNLDGESELNVLSHKVIINAESYTPVSENSIPTGDIKSVKNTPFDFLHEHTIGERISQVEGKGYDHNYVLNKQKEGQLSIAANVYCEESGINLEMKTTEPGVQFYTANYLDNSIESKEGRSYGEHGAFCLEAQHYPDSPNKHDFPNVFLKPNETYLQTTIYKFTVK